MRGQALRLKAEGLLAKARRAKSVGTVLQHMEDLCAVIITDNRRRVTDAMRDKVLEDHKSGATMNELVVTSGLSHPTIRKIIRRASL